MNNNMMNPFDWQSQLAVRVYENYPEFTKCPVIGITGNYGDQNCKLAEGYYKSVIKAGGVPVIIPPVDDTNVILNTLEHIDALILSGGGDYDPRYAGEECDPKLGEVNMERDLPELFITRLAYNRQIPILGICRGIQTLAMALGGKVKQDITDIATINHSQTEERSTATHQVGIEDGSMLSEIYDMVESIFVNSFHHQAVCDTGEKFRVVARSKDGIIEAMESTEFKPILGVQWHPECLADGLPIFQWLIGEAERYRETCWIHEGMMTLDSHCDTPMFFPQGVNFCSRDERLLVDLHKMTEGRLDATVMAAYIPQTTETGMKAMADGIFDKIEEIVNDHPDHLAMAHNMTDIIFNKGRGMKSILLAIENGAAIEGSLDNLHHFADRGIVYMTLCHNGDNDICDSAKGNHTHNGLSTFGRKVVKEMNELGVLIDLSHADEKTFYDVLELSKQPVVCSHSCCRALCDHPRNLTDQQMRDLAAHDGVMQLTLYHGFLRSEGEATIEDVMAHLDHAVDIMGVEHVGLGTDFDGDGGVRGLASASDLMQFTRKMLDHGYSEQEIHLIWGANFLRIMSDDKIAKILKLL